MRVFKKVGPESYGIAPYNAHVNNMYIFCLKVFWVCITLEVPGNVCKLKKWFFQEIYPSRESTRRLPVFLTLIYYY